MTNAGEVLANEEKANGINSIDAESRPAQYYGAIEVF